MSFPQCSYPWKLFVFSSEFYLKGKFFAILEYAEIITDLHRPLPPPETAKLTKLSQLYSQMYPQLNDSRPQGEKSPTGTNELDEKKRNYSEEVEEMVRLYFERLYTKDISPSRFASVLKVCRTSNDQRQVNFFSCTIHTLVSIA